MTKKRYRKSNLFLFLGSIFVAIAVSELALGLFWINPYENSGADHVVRVRIHHKNIDQTFDRSEIDVKKPTIRYRTNYRGYIELSTLFDQPDATIAFLGGSTTEAIAVSENKRFPFLVSKLLKQKGLKINTLNAARSGGTLHDSINILFNYVIEDKPSHIVLMNATNDIGVLQKEGSYRSRMGNEITIASIGKNILQLFSTQSNIAGLIRKIATFNSFEKRSFEYSENTALEIEPYKKRLMAFIGIAKAFGIESILMTQPIAGSIYVRNELTPEWMDAEAQGVFNQVIRDVGKNTGTTVIDLKKLITHRIKQGDQYDAIFYDGMHVTDYGSSLYAEKIAEILYKAIEQSRHSEG